MPKLIQMGMRDGVLCDCGSPIWQLKPGPYTCTTCKRTDDSSKLLEPTPQAAKEKGARPTTKAATTRKRPARKATKRKKAATARTRKETKPA